MNRIVANIVFPLIALMLSAGIVAGANADSPGPDLTEHDVAVIVSTVQNICPPRYGRAFQEGLEKKDGVWHYAGPSTPAVFYLHETTASLEVIERFVNAFSKYSSSELPSTIVSSLEERNAKPITLPVFATSTRIKLMKPQTLDTLRSDEPSTKPEDYGGGGIISLPIYFEDGKKAAVFFSYGFKYSHRSQTRHAGGWGIYLLKLSDNVWIIEKEYAFVT